MSPCALNRCTRLRGATLDYGDPEMAASRSVWPVLLMFGVLYFSRTLGIWGSRVYGPVVSVKCPGSSFCVSVFFQSHVT